MIAFTVVLALLERETRYILLPSRRLAVRYKLWSALRAKTPKTFPLFSSSAFSAPSAVHKKI